MEQANVQSSHPKIRERLFVYLTYIDDSDTRAKHQQWQVLGAVLIPDSSFFMLEAISANVIRDLVGEERYGEFTEFHACELYGGYQFFEPISQAKRFEAIETMLGGLYGLQAKVAYGAVDLEHLKRKPYASADPVDISFRMCIEGIESFFLQNIHNVASGKETDGGTAAIFIADEFDKGHKGAIQKSFRSMRGRYVSSAYITGMTLVHDDMYFGDSRYSIGLQVADLCSYFIARHLAGDAETERYYKMIEPMIIGARRDP